MKGEEIKFSIYQNNDESISTGLISDNGTHVSCVNYLSGLTNFDNLLAGKKFAETQLTHIVTFIDSKIIFSVIFKKEELHVALNLTQVTVIEFIDTQEIEVRKISASSRFFQALKSGGARGGGVAGVLVGMAIGAVGKKVSEWAINAETKMVKGSIIKIRCNAPKEEINTIELTCRSENRKEIFKLFLNHCHEKVKS